jgi:hypothetical protein
MPAQLTITDVRDWAGELDAIRRELARARTDAACGVLLNRAVDLVPLRAGVDPLAC